MSDTTSIDRLTADLKAAARTLSATEARFLVDAYYIIQEDRKRTGNQIKSMDAEPHSVIKWFCDQNTMLENHIKVALDLYTDSKPVGKWLKEIYGIGPVIAAGLMAHIDIRKAPTAGHIWSFAGLNPTKVWNKGEKRPWNAGLKTPCWKIGQSFMKFSNRPDCFYGKLYQQRKEYETTRNENGSNRELALSLAPKFNKSTDAYKHLMGGKLPPAQIDARARRWAVKIFLSHLQAYWWEAETGEKPPKPFAIAILGHAHEIKPSERTTSDE